MVSTTSKDMTDAVFDISEIDKVHKLGVDVKRVVFVSKNGMIPLKRHNDEGPFVGPHVDIGSGVVANPSAIIFQAASIGDGVTISGMVEIGAYAVVRDGTQIGRGARIGNNVTIEGKCQIGSGCLIEEYARIGQGVIVPDRMMIGKHSFVGHGVRLRGKAVQERQRLFSNAEEEA